MGVGSILQLLPHCGLFKNFPVFSAFAAARLRTRLLQPPSCDVYLKQMCPVCFISVSERAQKTRVKTTGVNFDETATDHSLAPN
jgi:hypothetical protein